MKTIHIRKGRDLRIVGAAEKILEEALPVHFAAVQPFDFHGLRPRLLVKEGEPVLVGTPILEHKDNSRIKVVSPVSGRIFSIERGEKRALNAVVIQPDGKQAALQQTKFSSSAFLHLERRQIVEHLLSTGCWAFIRQRPFQRIPDPDSQPKAIFIQAMNTEPLAADVDFILKGRQEEFQHGVDILSRLTEGKVHVCCSVQAKEPALINVKRAAVHTFKGPHPAGNVGTHIHFIDPLQKGEAVWYVDVQSVLAIAKSFREGTFIPERTVAVTGEKAQQRLYRKTWIGASVRDIAGNDSYEGTCLISGSVLSGRAAGEKGFLGFYDSQLTLLPEGGRRELLGWMMPGWNKYSFSRTVLSALKRNKEFSVDSDEHGSHRAIVFNDMYDRYVALDVMTFFLIKAILVGEIDEMEKLGILECAPEDFALASFVCPSKTDVCGIIQQGLDLIEKED
ncbi:MAG TPA: Na(+)-translocating NADH-quinone reductase subunit A [Candidatus Omnitrophota bacterium]|nr:Na(+)-translocating NADH-quinone reductase subunit A [Candidatus Omnitrophota bacterium]